MHTRLDKIDQPFLGVYFSWLGGLRAEHRSDIAEFGLVLYPPSDIGEQSIFRSEMRMERLVVREVLVRPSIHSQFRFGRQSAVVPGGFYKFRYDKASFGFSLPLIR